MKNRVEGHHNLYKDLNTGVITNNNNSDRERYRLAKANARKNMQSQDEIQELRDELSDIKDMLRVLINKNKH